MELTPIDQNALEQLILQGGTVWVIVAALKRLVDMGERLTQAVAAGVACGLVISIAWPVMWSPIAVYTLILAAATITAGPVGAHQILDTGAKKVKIGGKSIDIDWGSAKKREGWKLKLRKGED